jgi:hypothetical protein
MYADDAALFVNPLPLELSNLQKKILQFFGECLGLKVNMTKTKIFPIRLQPNMI